MVQSSDRILCRHTVKNFSICEAYQCNNQATKQIVVSAGYLGNVELNLCNRCVPKFTDSIVDKNNNDELTVLPEQLTPEVRMTGPNDNYRRSYL